MISIKKSAAWLAKSTLFHGIHQQNVPFSQQPPKPCVDTQYVPGDFYFHSDHPQIHVRVGGRK